MKCTICGKQIVLIPSAEERAAKDKSGKSAAYYRSLFRTHAECAVEKRSEESRRLMITLYPGRVIFKQEGKC